MNLTNFKNYLKINVTSINSQRNYFSRIKCFFDYYTEYTQENINAYIASKLDKGISKQWFNQTMTSFRHYEKCLGVYGNYTFNYPKYKKIPYKEREYLTKEEIENDLFPYFPIIFIKRHEFYKFIVNFLFYTGIRPNEMVNLKVNDIFFDKQYFIVRNPKDKDDRKVPFPIFLINDMKRWLNHEGQAFDVTKSKINNFFKRLNEELKYKKHLFPYMCRHGFAKYLLEKGVPLEKLQILMGHSDLKTTMIYAKPKEDDALQSYFNNIK